MRSFSVVSGSPAQTALIATALAERLRPGDIVLLSGNLAAGKTTFVKAVAEALGSTDPVTSPTFALAQFYATKESRILHVDTYRLADVEEYRDLGLEEYQEDAISLIEWGEKIAGEFPCHLAVSFVATDEADGRSLTFSATCDRWTGALADLHAAISKDTHGAHAGDRDIVD
ncbi:tRNA (adenosine(37)-N6)-threonylcarbamoyltransferase complex ATPase subunit type 1 TsaE [Catenuloplanes atrovinosus]|uniref:tRNA threonylcarbamoyladenosine biosynthesis protein TsaE n=1 Tax=Catenuloplanes atrovinosus TaxID=137266 RepID=A0AAE3YXL5_9ACTN|nr:tRNA (adenosine(37)-N6)-threonylcarbamoyltransferase complex ATPase subunit type 1 TsaE [Catenuloplanes atrovinosus]MDR7281062.1 tRNA threonylcarbamoyladenosine biosynthesis protein TsaE [Catenuloplanes atrovinosus]